MKIRDKNTSNQDFRRYGKRLMQVICEEAMGHLAVEATIDTPVEDSMLDTFMNVVPEAAVGKILIQRDEETAQPKLFYDKLPPLAGKQIILLDPMLATGGSAACAIEVLLKAGAPISKIMFINVLGCPEGMAFLSEAYPELTIFTGKVDKALNAKKYIVPGLGDYGDRFFGTV